MGKEPDKYNKEPVQSAFVPNAFLVASARRDERESRESRPGDETTGNLDCVFPIASHLDCVL